MEWISGTRLVDVRHMHCMKQREMAAILGCSQAFLSALETGTKGLPKPMEVALIERFDLPTNYFRVSLPRLVDNSNIQICAM